MFAGDADSVASGLFSEFDKVAVDLVMQYVVHNFDSAFAGMSQPVDEFNGNILFFEFG